MSLVRTCNFQYRISRTCNFQYRFPDWLGSVFWGNDLLISMWNHYFFGSKRVPKSENQVSRTCNFQYRRYWKLHVRTSDFVSVAACSNGIGEICEIARFTKLSAENITDNVDFQVWIFFFHIYFDFFVPTLRFFGANQRSAPWLRWTFRVSTCLFSAEKKNI